jgi:hypothetical protein
MVLRDENNDINVRIVVMYFKTILVREKILPLCSGINIAFENKHTDSSLKSFEYRSEMYRRYSIVMNS